MRLSAQALITALALTGTAASDAPRPQAPAAPSLADFQKHKAGGANIATADGATSTVTVRWEGAERRLPATVLEVTPSERRLERANRVTRQLTHRAGLVNDEPPRRHRPIVLPGQENQQSYQQYQAQYTPEAIEEVRYTPAATPTTSTGEDAAQREPSSSRRSQLRAPVVSGGYANTNLQGYASSSGARRPAAAPRPQPAYPGTSRPATAPARPEAPPAGRPAATPTAAGDEERQTTGVRRPAAAALMAERKKQETAKKAEKGQKQDESSEDKPGGRVVAVRETSGRPESQRRAHATEGAVHPASAGPRGDVTNR